MGERTQRKDRESGLSILETLIAVSILGVSILGMAQLVGIAVQLSSFARYSTAAISVARSKIEELRADYNEQLLSGTAAASLSDGSHGPENKIVQSDNDQVSNRSLAVSWTVSSNGPQKDVVVSVIPTGGSTTTTLRSKEVRIVYTLLP